MGRASGKSGFTLIELLVVVTMIGILVALLLPAVQSAREAARQLQCKNDLKQLALGCLHHEEAIGRLPTGGWGWAWTGDADLGTERKQPGGWLFNVLPYIEQQPLHDMGAGLPGREHKIWYPWPEHGLAKCDAHTQRLSTPLTLFICPTRRPAIAYTYIVVSGANYSKPGAAGRTDYAANGGDVCTVDDCAGRALVSPLWRNYADWDAGPCFLADGGVDTTDPTQIRNARDTFALVAQWASGVIYRGSMIRLTDITDGASGAYLAGEKNVGPDWYLTGTMDGDNTAALTGSEDDHERWTADLSNRQVVYAPPQPDTPGAVLQFIFGSAHANGCHMALCDGSVHMISYGIDREVHRRLGNRNDGLTISAGAW